jgi:hypothetical protein
VTDSKIPRKDRKSIRAKKDAILAEDEGGTHGRGVLVGKLDELREAFGLILRYGVAHIDSDTWVTEKQPDLLRMVGKRGPGHLDHPLTREIQKVGREAEITSSNLRRDNALRVAARKRSLDSQRETILRLYDAHQPWHCRVATEVAAQVGVTARHVRRVVGERNKKADLTARSDVAPE